MKKTIIPIILSIISIIVLAVPAQAQYADREGRFEVGLVFPSVFFGNKNIDAMMSGAVEGDYFIINNVSVGFRLEGATDFKLGDSPHSVFLMSIHARYTFDLDDSWRAYLGFGGGGALLGSSTWAGDINVVNFGGAYQFNDHLSVGVDSNMHVLIRSETAFAFSLGPTLRWLF